MPSSFTKRITEGSDIRITEDGITRITEQIFAQASLNASSGLTFTFTLPAGSALTGEPFFNAVGQLVAKGESALSSTGSKIVAGVKVKPGAANLHVVGTISGACDRTTFGATALTGEPFITIDGDLIASGSTSLTGTGTTSATPLLTLAGLSSLNGTGSMVFDPEPIVNLLGEVSLTGEPFFSADAVAILGSPTALQGTANLSVDGTRVPFAGQIYAIRGQWGEVIPYIYYSGEWREVKVYVKNNGIWKRVH